MMPPPSADFPGFRIGVGERMSSQMILSREEIATFARLSGDLNPLHHDEAHAQRTRFGGIKEWCFPAGVIASGCPPGW